MNRPTLKLPKRADRAAPQKAPSSRARRAQRAKPVQANPPPAPASRARAAPGRAEQASSAPAASAPAQAAPDRTVPISTGPAARTSAVAAPAAPAAAPASRMPPHENPGDPRLSKRMSELGLCSRREADEWIANGWVKVDGEVVDVLGARVPAEARIEIDPAALEHQGEKVTILLHKPMGYVSGQAEDGYQPAVVLIRPENRWAEDPSPLRFKPGHLRGLAPAGRLDIDSTGLLVFTQDGRVARHLIGQDSEVEKEYLVRVEGALTDEGLERLRHGLELDGVRLRPARVSWQNEHQLRFVLREGRKRQIRRMCELVGLTVTGLKRVRSGSVPLGRLPVGQWRYLGRNEKF